MVPDETHSALKEARRIARRMRRQGNSFARIAAEMGVAVSTVKAWLNWRAPRQRDFGGKRHKRPAITPRRRLFAKGLAEGKTAIQAAMDAGCPSRNAAARFAYQARHSEEFRDFFTQIMVKAGLDEESLARKLRECLDAEKLAAYAVNKATGTITDKVMLPDYHVRHQAVRTGFELHKRLGKHDEGGEKAGAVHLHVTLEQKRKYEELVGGPLAFDVITLPEGAEGEYGSNGTQADRRSDEQPARDLAGPNRPVPDSTRGSVPGTQQPPANS